MNDDRLTELMIQAEHYALSECGFCGHDDYNKTRNRAFAALIVEECIDIIRSTEQECLDSFRFMGESRPAFSYIIELRKQFSVDP